MGLTWDTQIKIAKGVLITNIIIGLISWIILDQPRFFLNGLVLGASISILNFRLAAITLEKAVRFAPYKAQVYVTSRYMVRYFILGIVIYISLKANYINIIGTIIGIMSLRFVVFQKAVFSKS